MKNDLSDACSDANTPSYKALSTKRETFFAANQVKVLTNSHIRWVDDARFRKFLTVWWLGVSGLIVSAIN